MTKKIKKTENDTNMGILAKYRILTRLVRYGQSLTPAEFKVMLFIFDRTIGFSKFSRESIPYRHFLAGVIRQSDGGHVTFSVGLGLSALKKALRGLDRKGVIGRQRTNQLRGTFYYLNYDWRCDGLLPFWENDGEDIDPGFYTDPPVVLRKRDVG